MRKVTPTLLIANQTTKKTFNDEYPVICYRNAFAISSLIMAHIQFFTNTSEPLPLFSDYFDIYPIIPSQGNGSYVATTPEGVTIGMGSQKFRGQTSPGFTRVKSPVSLIEDEVFKTLEIVWEETFIKRRGMKDLSKIALFRSLEMAYRATAMPFKNNASIHDYGASASLWVSAFEILSHPQNGNASLDSVLDMIEKYPLQDKKIKRRSYLLRKGKKKRSPRRGNLVQKLYRELYDTRNDFLHGNPVGQTRLHPFKNTHVPSITRFAPLVYKTALCAHLEPFRDSKDGGIWMYNNELIKSLLSSKN